MSALPKSRLPKEFKVLHRMPVNQQGPSRLTFEADSTARNEECEKGHQAFLDAVRAAFGMWKDRDDIPRDGLEYERWVRGKCPQFYSTPTYLSTRCSATR